VQPNKPPATQRPERTKVWTIGELLRWTTERFEQVGIDEPRVDAEHLLALALGCKRLELYVQHSRQLSEDERGPFRELVRRRLCREPVAYIRGSRGFHALDLDLSVDQRVLIPRPETEHLVDWLLEELPRAPKLAHFEDPPSAAELDAAISLRVEEEAAAARSLGAVNPELAGTTGASPATPTEHAPTDHAPTDHAPTEHAPTEHAPTEHASTEHASTEHAPTDHADHADHANSSAAGDRPEANARGKSAPDDARGSDEPIYVIDIGTGSGAIALAIKRARPDVLILAVDRSPEALAVAKANVERCGLDVRLRLSDLLDNIPTPPGGFHAIAANLPYIPTADLEELQPEVRRFEPMSALDGGADGLDLIRRLLDRCAEPGVLAKTGRIYLEIGVGQAPQVLDELQRRGFVNASARRDYGGINRVIAATAPPSERAGR